MQYIEQLFDGLGIPVIGRDAARALGEIVGSADVLTKQNFASVRVSLASTLEAIAVDNNAL